MDKNTRMFDASQFAENFVASVLLLQLLKEAQQQHIVEQALTLDQIAILVMSSQSPAEA